MELLEVATRALFSLISLFKVCQCFSLMQSLSNRLGLPVSVLSVSCLLLTIEGGSRLAKISREMMMIAAY